MASPEYLDRPARPLKILTIDGGGLRGLASLLIIDDLLNAVQKESGAAEKPRPCELFDMIAGIGAGGWIALLLGRFSLDIPTCILEWTKLMGDIVSHSTILREKRRLMNDSWFNRDLLISQVKDLTEVYSTGSKLVDNNPGDLVRSRYVLVAQQRNDKKHEYNLFRSYSLPPKVARRALPGPKNPEEFPIWETFCVTGAAKYFSRPWNVDTANNGRRGFRDRTVPHAFNITELVLNEAWDLWGRDVPMDVVINIGPGVISKNDFKLMSRSLSWPRNLLSKEKPRGTMLTEPGPLPRVNTRGSIAGMTPLHKAERTEQEIEISIERKLTNVYKENLPRYYRLAPPTSPSGSYLDDTRNFKATADCAEEFLVYDETKQSLRSAGRHWYNRSNLNGIPVGGS